MHADSCPLASRRVLFLDWDGVLQTPALPDWREMEHCDGLRELLSRLPDLEVVVTSTHREGRDLAGIRAMLPKDIGCRVTGATPVSPLGRANGGRQREILMWLTGHPGVAKFVAVDDEHHLYERHCPWLVLTNKWVGWTEETTLKVLRALRH